MTSPYIDRIDLTGKSVFVAGGTSGINLGIAEDFARADLDDDDGVGNPRHLAGRLKGGGHDFR